MRTVASVGGIRALNDRSVKRAAGDMSGRAATAVRHVRELMVVIGTSIDVARRVDATWHARSGARGKEVWWDDWAAVVSGAEPRP